MSDGTDTATATVTVNVGAVAELPQTGFDPWTPFRAGLFLLLSGYALVLMSNRRGFRRRP
jgi:hypothetical protein